MDISPLELRTRIEPLFDLDPMLHSTNPSRNRKSLDRRISFSRPPSSSSGVFVLPQTPSIDSIDVSHVSISSRSKSIDKGINHSIQNSPIVAKQLFPAESIETNSKLSKQEERDLQRKKLSQQSEPTWKSSNTRTQTGISKSSQKPDSKHPTTNDEKVEKKKTEKPSLYSVARALRSNTSNSSSKDSSHSVALETAAQKAAAIFTSRISKKTSKGMDDDSSQSSTIKRPISSESKRTPISSQIHKTPGSSTIQKNKTPTSTVRSSMTNLTSTPSHLSSTTSSASKNVQRSGSGSSATTLRRSVDTTSSTTSSSTSTYHSNLQSTTIKATGGHQFKPKSVTVSNNSTTHQQPSIPPPTLRGGGGGTRSSKLENSSSSNPATSTEMNTTTQRKTSERSKPSISVSTLQANKIGKTDRQLKHMSSSLSTVSDGGTNKLQSTTTTSSSSSQSSIPVSNEKIIQSSEPAINPFGALITKTPPRDV